MRLSDLPRRTSFRLALRFFLLFGTASVALCGFLYWETRNYVIGRVDDWLVHEQSIFSPMDRDNLLQRLSAHLMSDPTLERPVTLFNPSGRRLAGSQLSVPSSIWASMPFDTAFRFVVPESGHPMLFRGMAQRRPSGDILFVARDMEAAHEFSEVLIRAFIAGGIITILLGLAGAVAVGADSMRRIDAVTGAVQRIVNGDLTERLPVDGRMDDLDRLAEVINGMIGELERLMHEVKGVCDNIAHDLRTPLTRLLAGLERARRRAASAEEYGAAVDEAILDTRDLLQTFAALLRISEVENGARRAGFTDADLSAVLADAVELYDPMAEAKHVRLRFVPVDIPLLMRGDPNLLFEAVGNLIDNALKFTPTGGTVTVGGFDRDGAIGFEIADTGPGIPLRERDAVLRRFYRSEACRQTPGNGLGLALVAAVVRLHGMVLAIEDATPGCRVTISQRKPEDGFRHGGAKRTPSGSDFEIKAEPIKGIA